MCELQWTALAEFHLRTKEFQNEVYCLCSRVFTWPIVDGNGDFSASEEDILKDQKAKFSEKVYDEAHESNDTIKNCAVGDAVSCYCSASHTDNISTDEHDSLRDSHHHHPVVKTLQASDSGADLTEDAGCENPAWQKYWAQNGERLIWESWIAKYSAYINPEYLQAVQADSVEETSNQQKTEGSLKFSFDSLSPCQDSSDYSATLGLGISLLQVKDGTEQKPTSEIIEKNRMLVRNLSYSDSYDKLNHEIEGWNPLSPVSNDCETEAERLLSSRCASHTGSSARTVDSMTNVTRMTVSSLDLSESSKNSDSFSSVSSIQSSITSTSSEEADEGADHEQQWNLLWSKHYEQEYLEHYRKFVFQNSSKMAEIVGEMGEWVLCDLKDFDAPKAAVEFNEEATKLPNLDEAAPSLVMQRRVGKRKGKEVNMTNSVGYLLKRLQKIEEAGTQENMSCTDATHVECENKNVDEQQGNICEERPVSTESNCLPTTDSEINQKENMDVEYVCCEEENEQMLAMGIPLSFKQGKQMINEAGGLEIQKKNSFEEENLDQSSSNRIKAAFNLIGIEMQEGQDKRLRGSFEYRLKHIRSQNRRLQFRNTATKPKHIHFDDDGQVICEDSGGSSNEVTVQNSHQDELLGIYLSSSSENEAELAPDEVDRSEESTVKRRKRRRRSNLPSEIKDNPKLRKFWQRRYSLFSKFDQGIKLDEESWFSVTPELIAQHTAERCQCDVIVDAFCGAGGNAIQFALTCQRVIAVDIDPKKIELAQHNAQIYGVAERIDFIIGDFFQVAEQLRADVVFLSPPWGGLQYRNHISYDLNMLQPAPLNQLLRTAQKISSNVAVFLPKNSNTYPLVIAAGPGGKVEIEQNFLGKRLIALTAYYGSLVKEAVPQMKSSKDTN